MSEFQLEMKKRRLMSAASLRPPLTVALVSHSQVGQREALGAHHVQDPRVHRGGEDDPLRSDAGESRLPGVTAHTIYFERLQSRQHHKDAVKRGAVLSRPSC